MWPRSSTISSKITSPACRSRSESSKSAIRIMRQQNRDIRLVCVWIHFICYSSSSRILGRFRLQYRISIKLERRVGRKLCLTCFSFSLVVVSTTMKSPHASHSGLTPPMFDRRQFCNLKIWSNLINLHFTHTPSLSLARIRRVASDHFEQCVNICTNKWNCLGDCVGERTRRLQLKCRLQTHQTTSKSNFLICYFLFIFSSPLLRIEVNFTLLLFRSIHVCHLIWFHFLPFLFFFFFVCSIIGNFTVTQIECNTP